MSFIQNLFTSRDNQTTEQDNQTGNLGTTYVGQEGRLWWNPDTNAFYYSDGNTAGGIPVGGGSGGNGVPGGPTNSIQYNAGGGNFGGTSNLTVSGNGISVTGNVTTATFFIGDGSQLTGIVTNYSNANVAAYLPVYSGNISGGNIGVSGAINAVGEITSFANIVVSSGGYFQGDGSQLTNLPIQPGTYSNANVAAYLPTYTGNLGPTNILTNNYLYANGQSIFANIQLTGNIDLGNLYIIDETIYGKNTDQNIILSPAGNGYVQMANLQIYPGGMLQGEAQVSPIIASLVLNQVLANSTGPGNTLPAGSYGNPQGIAAPWAVYQFTTVPSPILEVNDVIAGTGVPVPSVVQWVGNTSGTDSANANVVVTSGSYSDLPTPIPGYGNAIAVTRAVTLAGLDIVSSANTTINLLPGTAGNIILGSSILPAVNDAFDLGSPTKRWRSIYFGGYTIYVYDPVLGVDQSISAYNGNLVVGGGTGLNVGEFTLFGNTIAIANPDEDIFMGTELATGNVVFNRPIQVLSNVAYSYPTFEVTRNGLTTINVASDLPNTEAALNVVGASSGNSYPRNFSATLVQLTNLDNEPARLSADAFGANTTTGQNAYFAIAGRAARGNVDSPGQTLANDTLTRITSQAFNNAGAFQGSIVRYNQMATGNVTTTSAGTRHNFQATPTGSVVIKNIANIDAAGLTLTSFANGGVANTGITFQDGSFQNTAFTPSSAVTSITVGVGLTQTASTGNVGIDATGVLSVIGTDNQINVANVGQNLTLSLPQGVATNSTVTFANLTITGNLTVNGTTTTANSESLNGKILYLANASTSNTQIDGGGIILGNADSSYKRSILYSLTNDWWDTDGAGFKTLALTANDANIANLRATGTAHFGTAYEGYDYPYAEIQIDANVNSYSQVISTNHSPGTNASSDFVATNDIGTDSANYIDLGINSSNYANADYQVSGANDGYLYINGGNLAIGTQSPANAINFFTGGTDSTSYIRAVIDDTALSMKNANVLVQDGNDNSIIELRTDGNIVFNGSSTLNLTGGFHVSSVSTNAGDANIVNYVGGAFVYGPALKDYAGNLKANIFTATGNIIGANLTTSGLISAIGNVTGGNIRTVGLISATGNITGNYILGNGSQLTGLVTPVNADWTSTSGLSQILHKTGASGPTAIALGQNAAGNVQGTGAIAIGVGAAGSATTSQGADAIAIGTNAGGALYQAQGDATIAIGKNAGGAGFGTDGQKQWSVAIGNEAGNSNQDAFSVALGAYAGRYNQGSYATALGQAAGLQSQGQGAVAIGQAGYESQGAYAVAIGSGAGDTNQGNNAIAIGYQAGTNNQTANSIILNASGSALDSSGVAGLFINPVRNNLSSNANVVFFNTSTKELTYANTISLAGNITGGNIRTVGVVSATGNVTAAYHIGNGSLLTSLTGANVTGTVANATYAVSAGSATTAGTVTTAAQPNITSVGTLTSLTSNGVVNFANTSNVSLGAVANVHVTGGSANNVLITNGSGNLSFASLSSINGVGGNQLVYALNAQQTIGSAKNTLLSLFGLTNGVALASNTRYQYEILFNSQCSKAGTLSYALALSGGAVVAQHNYNVISNKTTTIDNYTAGITMMSQNATGNAITTAQTVADTATFTHTIIQGTIDVTTGGNVNFMVSQDQNTPVTWTVNAGSYVKLLPLGAIGSNTVDGTWS
jgi:hypothetical protein